jgi:hypothetical protein
MDVSSYSEGPVAWGLGKGLTTHRHKRSASYGMLRAGPWKRPAAGSCEQGDEPSGSVKGGVFLD